MFYINDDMSIYITRGDSAAFSVMAENGGAPYVFQPGEVVRFKVTERKNCTNVVLQKDVAVEEETDNVIILLDKVDTKIGEVISKPVDYWYEVERNPHTDPQTIIGYDEDGAKIFKLFPEGNDELPDIDEEDIPLIDDTLSLTSERPIQNQAVSRAIFGIIRAIEMDEDIPTEEYYGMKGATEDEDGSGGFAPAPKKGEQDFVLYGDGTWREPKGGGGGISQDEIQTAVNDALRIAKESGEFDGKDGAPGKDGYTPVKGVDYFDGAPGKDGYTPVKGVDYFDGQPGKNGNPGVYIGSGDMPEGYNVQIDPNGDAFTPDDLIPEGGGGDSWRLVSRIILTEDATSIQITEDSDGNAFALKKFHIVGCLRGATGNTGSGYLFVQTMSNPSGVKDRILVLPNAVPANGARKTFYCNAELCGESLAIRGASAVDGTSEATTYSFTLANTGHFQRASMLYNPISDITISASNSGYGANTMIDLWGVDA